VRSILELKIKLFADGADKAQILQALGGAPSVVSVFLRDGLPISGWIRFRSRQRQ